MITQTNFDANHFDIRKTYDPSLEPEYYAYSGSSEHAIISQAFPKVKYHISEGNTPEYDAIVDFVRMDGVKQQIKIEIKTTSTALTKGNGMFVECSQEVFDYAGSNQHNRIASGLTLSEADFYLFVHPETNNNEKTLKVRLVPTKWLQEAYQHLIDNGIDFLQLKTPKNPQGFAFDIYNNHFWFGDFSYVNQHDWDISSFRRNGVYKAQIALTRYLAKERPIGDVSSSLMDTCNNNTTQIH